MVLKLAIGDEKGIIRGSNPGGSWKTACPEPLS
jgi:hypothetical protein